MKTALADFHRICAREGIPSAAYSVVPGFYQDTLTPPNDLVIALDCIALAYIDCDLYSSTMIVLRYLMPKLRHGMILAFDDYYCYSGEAMSGERSACLEFFEEATMWQLIPYIQFGWHGMSFVLEKRVAELRPRA